jgi:hypothetical protein
MPKMKTHWFSVLSVAGIILLAGNVLGNELRWAKPATNGAAVPSATHVPAVIATDDVPDSPAILQVQRVEPILPPLITSPSAEQLDRDYSELRRQSPSVPPGAALQNAPSPLTRITTVPCESIGLKSIREISHDIRPANSDQLPEECVIDSAPFYGRHFSQTCFMWKASAVSTKAAYFEDVQLERYGNTIVCPALQPVMAGVKFFATVPILPYKMGVTPPNECVYTLGHRRPGNYAPYMVKPFPISPRGALFQAGAVAGALAVIP